MSRFDQELTRRSFSQVEEKYESRLSNRWPLVGGWIRRKALRELCESQDAGAALLLARAAGLSPFPEIRAGALEKLKQVTSQVWINRICKIWSEHHCPSSLTELILQNQWVATGPPPIRIHTALLVGKPELLLDIGKDSLEMLLFLCRSQNPDMTQNALFVLSHLKRKETQNEVCEYIIQGEAIPEAVIHAAIKEEYTPKNDIRRALFFLMSGQMKRYEALDFDYNLLRMGYSGADANMQSRICKQIRELGRIELLGFILGGVNSKRMDNLSDRESRLCIDMFSAEANWKQLWKLSLEMPFSSSMAAVKKLIAHQWAPEEKEEQALFEKLSKLLSLPIASTLEEMHKAMPAAIKVATAHVSGRINDMAFSPTGPQLALGTSNRNVALWDFEKAQIVQKWTGFGHSVSQVAFSGSGVLACGERTNRDGECGLFICLPDGQKQLLMRKRDSITAVESAGKSWVLISTSAGDVELWDLAVKTISGKMDCDFWPRWVRVSGDGERALLLHRGVQLLDVKKMEPLQERTTSRVFYTAAFAPQKNRVIIGRYMETAYTGRIEKNKIVIERHPFVKHAKRIKGIETLPNIPVVVSIGSSNDLKFTLWDTRQTLEANWNKTKKKTTALRVSPDGQFLAIGFSDASLEFMDLRPLTVRFLIAKPLSKIMPDDIEMLLVLIKAKQLAPRIRNALEYIQAISQHRCRYDIELATHLHTIQPGEFDIEIEG